MEKRYTYFMGVMYNCILYALVMLCFDNHKCINSEEYL